MRLLLGCEAGPRDPLCAARAPLQDATRSGTESPLTKISRNLISRDVGTILDHRHIQGDNLFGVLEGAHKLLMNYAAIKRRAP